MPNILSYTEITDAQDDDAFYVVRGTGPGSDKFQERSNIEKPILDKTKIEGVFIWDATITYNLGTSFVQDDNKLWVSSIGSNLNNQPSLNIDKWDLVGGSQKDNILHIQDQKTSTTGGGTFTSGAWQRRDLNQELTNTIDGAILSSNQITLTKGAYIVDIICPAYDVIRHATRLQDITSASTLLHGTGAFTATADPVQTPSFIRGVFVLVSTKTIEVQHRCERTISSIGFGVSMDFTDHEVYTDVMIKKIG